MKASPIPSLLVFCLWSLEYRDVVLASDSETFLLIRDLSRCTIHFVEYRSEIIEYKELDKPYLFSSTKLWRKNPRYQARPIFKMKHIQCFITIFLIDGYGLKLPVAALSPVQSDPFSFIMNSLNVYQRYILFLLWKKSVGSDELNFVRSLNVNHQTFLSPIFFIQYTFGASTNTTSTLAETEMVVSGIRPVNLNEGWFVCKYCSPFGYVTRRFRCASGKSCYQNMANAYAKQIDDGKSVLWQVYSDSWTLDPDNFDKVVQFPFVNQQEGDVTKITLAFLLSSLNRTLLKEAITADAMMSSKRYDTPKIILKIDRIFARGTMTIVGNGRSFFFVTADGVYDMYDAKSFYVAPLEMEVWHLLIGILMFLTILVSLAYLTQDFYQSSRSGWVTFLWIVGILLEQNDMKRRPTRTKNETALQTSATVYGFWIFTCVLMSGFYKGRISANYSAVTRYGSPWRQLEQILNFTFYSAIEHCDFFSDVDYILNNNTIPNLDFLCGKYSLDSQDAINCKFWVDMEEQIYYRQVLALQTARNERDLAKLKSAESRLSYTCTNYMPKLAKNELRRPETAFVISKNDFPMYWEFFEESMARNSSVRFVNNKDEKDDFLSKWKVYFLSTTDEFHKRLMHKRMKVIVTCGFIQLWDRWSVRIRNYRAYRNQAVRKSHREKQITLSFSGSDIRLIFYTLFIGLGFCSLLLVAENIYSTIWKIQRAKACPFEYLQ